MCCLVQRDNNFKLVSCLLCFKFCLKFITSLSISILCEHKLAFELKQKSLRCILYKFVFGKELCSKLRCKVF